MGAKHRHECQHCGLKFNDDNKNLFPIEKHKLKDGSYGMHYRQSRCKVCAVKRQANLSKSNRLTIKELKEKTPCKDCGKHYPYYVMQFDHIKDKDFNIGARTSVSVKKLKLEIDKCEIVCANCHAERTYQRKLNNKK